MAKNKNKNKNQRKNKIKSKKKRLDINKLKAVADAPLIESSSKNKSSIWQNSSLIPLLLRRWNLKRELKMLMKSLFLDLSSKFLKNTVISPLNFYHFFLCKFLHSKTLAKEKLFRIIINPKASKKDWNIKHHLHLQEIIIPKECFSLQFII